MGSKEYDMLLAILLVFTTQFMQSRAVNILNDLRKLQCDGRKQMKFIINIKLS